MQYTHNNNNLRLVVWSTMLCFSLYIYLFWSHSRFCTAQKRHLTRTHALYTKPPKILTWYLVSSSKKYETAAHTMFGEEGRSVPVCKFVIFRKKIGIPTIWVNPFRTAVPFWGQTPQPPSFRKRCSGNKCATSIVECVIPCHTGSYARLTASSHHHNSHNNSEKS